MHDADKHQAIVQEFKTLLEARFKQTGRQQAEVAAEIAMVCGGVAIQGLLDGMRAELAIMYASNPRLLITAMERIKKSVLEAIISSCEVQLAAELLVLEKMATSTQPRGPIQ